MIEKLENLYSLQESCSEIEKELPEHFFDPLTSEVMKDPVKLPSSGKIVDRITIKKHLLNDKSDPYNRDYLVEGMLIPLPELKFQIE